MSEINITRKSFAVIVEADCQEALFYKDNDDEGNPSIMMLMHNDDWPCCVTETAKFPDTEAGGAARDELFAEMTPEQMVAQMRKTVSMVDGMFGGE